MKDGRWVMGDDSWFMGLGERVWVCFPIPYSHIKNNN